MKKILVIDDAEFILESTSTLLSFEGYEVITASDGLEGVDAAFKHDPDLILCDISMPNLDGYGVIDKIRENDKTNGTPFIFLTAFTEKQNMRMGMEKGADDFLVKPYTRDELLAAIDTQWKKYSLVEKKIQKKVEEVGKNLNYALPHEFRTVINQVKGSAKILSSEFDNFKKPDVDELTDDIISSCDRLLKITENFLIYVRIESYMNNPDLKSQLRASKTDEPGALIYDVFTTIAMKFNRMDDMKIDNIPDGLFVEINSESYHKIIDELIDNAYKFSNEGSPVEIKMELRDDSLWTEIIDYGRGMSKEQINNIGAYVQFERTIYEQQGVGLGLVIAKKLVEVHDGEFIIDSEENNGTRIKFSLPYQKTS
jgi:K+-sensing histidine kinase KdpD